MAIQNEIKHHSHYFYTYPALAGMMILTVAAVAAAVTQK